MAFVISVDLGSGLSFETGSAVVYGMKNGEPAFLKSISLNGPVFTVSISNLDDYNFFYTVVRVGTYNAGSGTVSTGDRNIFLLSIFRNTDIDVSVGERETIANTFCFGRFLSINTAEQTISLRASDRDLEIMYGMRDNFISVDGTLSLVISRGPNGQESNSYPMFNFLSNLLYYCITDPDTYKGFTELSAAAAASGSTFQAFMVMIARPWSQVQAIYDLIADKNQVYSPSLTNMYSAEQLKVWSPVPNQWTLTIKINKSGAQNFIISGPGYIAFDKNDRAWVSTNMTAGTQNSCTFCVAFNSDGSPADFSPVFGGGLLGGGFGAAANLDGSRIIFGNYGWGPKDYNPQHGSISVIDTEGNTLSPQNGYIEKLSRVQGVMYDKDGNLWMASWGTQTPMGPADPPVYDFPDQNSAIVVYLNFDGTTPPREEDILVYYFDEPNPYNCTFDVAFDNQGNAFVSNSGGRYTDEDQNEVTITSSVYKLRISTDGNGKPYIEKVNSWPTQEADKGYQAFRQVNVNSRGEVYVASVIGRKVIRFDNNLETIIGEYTYNIGSPWGITFDSNDSMYVANFFALDEEDTPDGEGDVEGTFGVTFVQFGKEEFGQLMSVPTGGSPVTLDNGYGTYGSDAPPSYKPITRLTGTGIDRVGNLWALNNFKASLYADFSRNPNPGGDGIVIFIGAAPPNPQNY